MIVLAQEYVAFDSAVQLLESIIRAVQHMHQRKRLHGDIKPLNLVRMPDGTWRVIDLDAVVRFLETVGAKDLSTAYAPPEATLVKTEEKRVVFRVPRQVDEKDVLVAHPTFDIWSLGVIMFMALSRRSLFESDNRDRLRDNAEALKLALWGATSLGDAVAEVGYH